MLDVFVCSSKQIDEFINCVKKQSFGNNTTIVLVRDHASMDREYGQYFNDYDRKCYYTIINPDNSLTSTSNRELNSFDLFPTTIASLGISWNSNRLDLGTNLYTNEESLLEKYGDDLNEEIMKFSSFL